MENNSFKLKSCSPLTRNYKRKANSFRAECHAAETYGYCLTKEIIEKKNDYAEISLYIYIYSKNFICSLEREKTENFCCKYILLVPLFFYIVKKN